MAREDPHFRLRIPETLRQQVQRAADLQRRSMTAEIVARLERTFAMDAANEDIYRRLSGGEPPESPTLPERGDEYGVKLPHSTDPAISAVEAEFHHEMSQLALRMARKLVGLREGLAMAVAEPARAPKAARKKPGIDK